MFPGPSCTLIYEWSDSLKRKVFITGLVFTLFFGGVTFSSASVSTNMLSKEESLEVDIQKMSEITPMFWADVGDALFYLLVGQNYFSDPIHRNVIGKANIPNQDFNYEEIVESFDFH